MFAVKYLLPKKRLPIPSFVCDIYLKMNENHYSRIKDIDRNRIRWQRLTSDQRSGLLLEHTEWAVFRSVSLGIDVDKRSLDAVIEARRLIFDDRRKDIAKTIGRLANKTLDELGGIQRARREPMDKCSIAYICRNVLSDIGAMDTLELGVVYDFYMVPTLLAKSESPLVRWLSGSEEIE